MKIGWRRCGLGLMCALLLLTGTAVAQTETVSRGTYLRLLEVQKLWETEDYPGALTMLRELASKTQSKPYDHAVVHQYIANSSYLAGQTGGARQALEVALGIPDLPEKLISELKLFYGQLVLGDEDFELARRMLEDWYALTDAKKLASQLFSLAYANYQTRNLERAEQVMVETLSAAPRTREQWYRLYYQILFELEKFADAESVLYTLLDQAPDREAYWRLLASHYLQLDSNRDALAAMAIAHLQQLLTDPDDLRRLTSLYSIMEIPGKAARLLEQFLADDVLPETPEVLRQLGDLWLLARERPQAKSYLARAASVAPDGKTYELLASIQFEDEDWSEAHQNFLKALDMGGIDDPHRLHLLAGVSAFRAGMTDPARTALKQARESDAFRSQADALLKRLQ